MALGHVFLLCLDDYAKKMPKVFNKYLLIKVKYYGFIVQFYILITSINELNLGV